MSLSIPSEIADAVKDVRKDKTSTDFCLVTYDGNSTLRLVASGEGGLSALRDNLVVDDVCYGLLRLEYEYETVGVTRTETTKFIFVYYRPDNISIKRKMKIGVFDGQVKKLFTPHHTSFEAASPEELTDEAILELVGNVTNRASHATEEKGTAFFVGGKRMSQKKEKRKSKSKEKGYDTLAQGVKGANVSFPNLDELKDAIEDVRSDSTTQWCLFGYEGKESIVFTAKGDGDVSQLMASCEDNKVNYGLYRFTEMIDKTTAVRYCFIVWTPDGVSPTTKARVSTHKGTVTPMFRPYQVDFYVTERNEISDMIILEQMSGLSGTRSHETGRPKSVRQEKYERKMLGGVSKETQKLEIQDEDALKAAIQAVRDDSNETTWVVATHKGKKKKEMKLILEGTGSGGIAELNAQFKDGKVMYGLLRYTQIIDKSETIKFLFVHFQAEDVSPTVKGNTGVLKGAVTALFSPYHAERFISAAGELTDKDLKKLFADSKAKW